jgi:pimeloyl-ACP methyl ester carboxylesterase
MDPGGRVDEGNTSKHNLVAGVSRLDSRFTYLAHAPDRAARRAPPGLLVAVHGSDYQHEETCRFFAALGDETDCVVLAPLFGPATGARTDPDGYKVLRSPNADYDKVLIDMVAEAATRFGASVERFFLFGFSGGAQFAHRLCYLYPERLHALAVAAPGMVTLIQPAQPLWVGTADLQARMGCDLNIAELRRVRVQLLVGSEDAAPHFGAAGAAAYNFAGPGRLQRVRALAANYRMLGIPTQYVEVQGAGHDFEPLAAAAVPFLRTEILRVHAKTDTNTLQGF